MVSHLGDFFISLKSSFVVAIESIQKRSSLIMPPASLFKARS